MEWAEGGRKAERKAEEYIFLIIFYCAVNL